MKKTIVAAFGGALAVCCLAAPANAAGPCITGPPMACYDCTMQHPMGSPDGSFNVFCGTGAPGVVPRDPHQVCQLTGTCTP